MLRGWVLAILSLSFCCPAGQLKAQTAGVSLGQRLGFTGGAQATDARMVHDAAIQPAAAAQRNASSRQSGQQPRKKSLFGIRMPGFLSGSGRSESEQDISNPPLPYGDTELGPQRRTASNQPNRNAASQPRTTASQQANRRAIAGQHTPQSAATARQQAGARPQQTTQRPAVAAPHTNAASAAATPRVARSSPALGNRHNELAEALEGLTGPEGAGEARNPASAPDGLPSYLQHQRPTDGSPTTPRMQSKTTARSQSAAAANTKSVDVRDALLDDPEASPQVKSTPTAKAAPVGSTKPAPKAAAPSNASSAAASKPAASAASMASQIPDPTAIDEMVDSVAVAPPLADETGAGGPVVDEPSTAPAPAVEVQPSPVAEAIAPAPSPTSKPWTAAPSEPAAPQTLVTCRQPVIVSNIQGPQQIIVGHEAEYRVTLENRGDEPARELVAMIEVPAWAEIVDATASNGVLERAAQGAESQPIAIKWQLFELPSRASQTLTLQIIPRAGKPLQFGVEWSHAPALSQATVEVQEPKVHMDIAGPAEVLFGQSQRYTLSISNPGTGPAEDVMIELLPPGGDQNSLVRHRVGSLAAGENKTVELELTAREPGELKIQATALAAGNLRSDVVKAVLCRKAELEVDWRGPEKNFAGAVGAYFFRVRNPGTATAEQVSVSVTLPPGAELVNASDGHRWDAAGRAVVWQAPALNANEERYLQLRCRMSQPGANKIDIAAQTAAGDLTDAESVSVAIEALADLKLEISDPKGILPVGETAVYEIKVRNRGLIAARGVNVVALFSEGIEPTKAEGAQHEINDGRVAFRTMESLPAGAEAVFRIHAQGRLAGTHLFRTEVACDDLGTKLSAEETTRFFLEEQRWADASAAYGSEEATQTH